VSLRSWPEVLRPPGSVFGDVDVIEPVQENAERWSSGCLVMIGYDGSAAACRAIELVATRWPGAQVAVVHVIHHTPAIAAIDPAPGLAAISRPPLAVRPSPVAQEGVTLARLLGLRAYAIVRTAARHTDIATTLIKLVSDHQPDMLIVGRGRRSRARTWITGGGVTQTVLRRARCPVMVIPPPDG
jgi:nucleotide-binding universal stress UspA family protein